MAGPFRCLSLLALLSLAVVVSPARITEGDLSGKVKAIYRHILGEIETDESPSPISKDFILNCGKFRGHHTAYGDTDEFRREIFYDRIADAREEVLMTTFIFDKTLPPTPNGIREAILELEKRGESRGTKVRFFLAYDQVGTAFFQKKMMPLHQIFKTRHSKDPEDIGLPNPKKLKWVDLQVKTYHRHVLGALHSKMMLIDGHTTIMGSKNMDGDTCLEYMYVMQGPVTKSLRADYQDIWKEKIPDLRTMCSDEFNRKSGDVPVLVVSRREGHHIVSNNIHAPQDQAWLKALEVAQKHVFIQTPNFCEKAIARAVIAAVSRGVQVTVVTSFRQQDFNEALQVNSMGSNSGTMNDMYDKLKGDSSAGKLRWCWYIGTRAGPNPRPSQTEWSHVKFMQVDDEFAIIGSGNQDPQSWFHSRENNLLIDDPDVAIQMRQKLMSVQQSQKYCYNGAPGEKRAK